MQEKILELYQEAIDSKLQFQKSIDFHNIAAVANCIINTIEQGKKILICGNGGSASDSLHFAAELVGRFEKNRDSLPAIALNSDVAILTAVGNDYGYEHIFERQVDALGNEGDCLIGLSTSGNSKNIILATQKAKEKGLKTIGFLGRYGGQLNKMVDLSIIVSDNKTARIQEIHIILIHIICSVVENYFFKKD